ncbi:type IV secretion protein Rhs [Yersinia entomophaga]|uniref:Type IV secretion protein Rhs n=2 Tax=Yersinia TaxID=629 RepID=A0ABM6BG43_YERET|nr:RHS repeat-associated core domain-containing protein [Yersinia entomophaga]ANI28418.1 type IV secretion protein Rhs [Yersinia entomophaga]
MSLTDDIVQRIARVGAIHASPKPVSSGAPGPAAARLGDPIKHASFLGALAGAVVGALISVAIFAVAAAVVVGTGGLATVAVLALGTAGTFAMGGIISKASSAVSAMVDSVGPTDGVLLSGSGDVFIEGKAAARATGDTAMCSKHSAPATIAQGSESVAINGMPSARVGDKLTCGPTIKSGASTVFIGSGQGGYLEVAEEFSMLEKAILVAVEFLVPPSKGLLTGTAKLFTKAGSKAAAKGAIMGAKQAAKICAGKTLSCVTAAFKSHKGIARFTEAGKKFVKGDPIDVVTGQLVEQRTDLMLGQTLSLAFTRTWAEGCFGVLGANWADSFSEYAVIDPENDSIEIFTQEGSSLNFSLPDGYAFSFNPDHPDFTVTRGNKGVILTDRRSGIQRHFALVGQKDRNKFLLSAHQDINGNHIDFCYDERQQLTRICHSDGSELTLIWNASQQLTEIRRTDEGLYDVLASYRYHDSGFMAEADSTEFYHLFYEYNAQGWISRWHDNDQTWTAYHYDAQGRCTDSIGADGYYPVHFDYLPGLTRVSNPQGATTEFYFTPMNQVTEVRSPTGNITRYEYDSYGNLLSQITPSGHQITLSYLKDTGLVTSFTNAMGACWQYSYDDSQRLFGITDPLERTWLQQYDEKGNPQSFTAPDGSSITLERNEFGLVTTQIHSDGSQRRMEYDHHQRLFRIFDEEQRVMNLRYDSRDNLQTLSTPGGALWRWRYDRHQRLAVSDRPNNSQEHFTHDRHGNLTQYHDANGVSWTVEYGAFDLPISRRDGEGHIWRYRYDADTLQLIAVTNPQGESYRYTLDSEGRVIEERDYADAVWYYRYDAEGNCSQKQDALGNITHYSYDPCGRLLTQSNPEGATQYQYDMMGRLLSVTAPDSTLHFEYDEQDRPIREIQVAGEILRRYPDNQTLEREITSVGHESGSWLTRIGVNRTGELIQLELPAGQSLQLQRDAAGQEAGREAAAGFMLRQQYDLMGQVIHQRAGRNTRVFRQEELSDIPQPTLAELDREYQYDAGLQLVAINDDVERLNYVVNGNGQVISVSERNQLREHYRYDASGYPLPRRVGDQQCGAEDEIYHRGHRLNRLGNQLYEYDAAGRMTARRTQQEGFRPEYTRFIWNSQNQLVELRKQNGDSWRYRYDAFGRRISKTCEQQGIRVSYLWDGDVIAEIRDYRQGELQKIRHWVFNGWELIAQQECRVSEGEVGEVETHYAVSAPTGEPLALFNPAGKRVWQRANHSLYGAALAKVLNHSQPEPGLKFAGQLLDEESGLHYNRFRYYDPQACCYLSPDPIGLAGGLNLYAYVPNPLTWIDPLGLATCPPVGNAGNDGYKFSFGSLRHILRRHSPHVGPPKQEPYASMKPKRQKGSPFPSEWSNRDIAHATVEVANNPANQVISNREGFFGKVFEGTSTQNGVTQKIRVITDHVDPHIGGTGPGVITSSIPIK